jgi:hypothetical protein
MNTRSVIHAYLKSLSPAIHQIVERYSNIIIYDLTMPLRGMVVTENQHRPDHLDAGCVSGHDNDTLLPITTAVIWI